jgi:hypothetical protein
MVGHVEAVEPGGGIVGQRSRGGFMVVGAPFSFLVGDLPEAGDDARAIEAGCEKGAGRAGGTCHNITPEVLAARNAPSGRMAAAHKPTAAPGATVACAQAKRAERAPGA